MKQRQAVHFYLNGTHHEVIPTSPTQTALQFLREQLRLTGTKEGCAEGDCGACTVLEVDLDTQGRLRYKAINACIRFLPTLDGKVLFTVEGLAGSDGGLHPVQQALVDHHGSQCGFCTPGFVMSMYAMYCNGQVQPERDQVLDSLSGNLCRCTGYRPIIDAAQSMHRYPACPPDHAHIQQCLHQLNALTAVPLAIQGFDGTHYAAPVTVDHLAQTLQEHPQATLLAGGTDVGLWVTKQLRRLPEVVYLGNVAELNHVVQQRDGVVIGANVSLNDAFQALVQHYPEATELWQRFASMPIRNSGTLVGNLANGSPIGDSAPLLIALQARVTLRLGGETRTLPLEQLYLDYRKQDRRPGEFVQEVFIPLRRTGLQVAVYKVSKRFDQDISAVCGAYALLLDAENRVASIRIAYGGMAATSRRALATEQVLAGRLWSETAVHEAMSAMGADFTPLSDMRASAAYRLNVAANLLLRFYLETTGTRNLRTGACYANIV